MKRYLIPIVAVVLVLAVAWAAFGQAEERARQRESMRQRFQNMSEAEREKFRAQMRERGGRGGFMNPEEQQKAIKAIEAQLAKLKAAQITRPEGGFQNLSEDERTKLREKIMKVRQERQKALQTIIAHVARLQGRRQPAAEAGQYIILNVGDLKPIQASAVKEKAKETAQLLDRLIARYQRGSRVRVPEPRPKPERLERPARQERDVQDEGSGRRAPSFELKSFDGKTVSLSDYRGKIVVLEWFNFECPLSLYHYETKNTMVGLANKYKGKNVVWLAVNSTSHTTPGPNKTFAKRHGLPYLILDDRSGKVGRAYGAETTPHMYIINPRGSIVYEGAIDDSPLGRKKVGVVNYVDNALAELTAGKAVSTAKTKPYGCTVKYAKK
jgi:peroxiredoxin